MNKSKLTIGILAHVDAGKTTLSEGLLYLTGSIRKMGRVDHKDAFLDTFELEKNRGITIFSKLAKFSLNNHDVTLLDTPGHVDFSAEMERTLGVLDYAILVINGADGIQGHTLTVWKLLKKYHVPTFIFVNKMDLIAADKRQLLDAIHNRLSERCIDFSETNTPKWYESLAFCDEQLMEHFIEKDVIQVETLQAAIVRRHVFPVYFGSALKLEGVEPFVHGMDTFMKSKKYPEIFGGRVFKISRDEKGNRLSYVKVTGGCLKVKSLVGDKKIDQIRIYSGSSYTLADEVDSGSICVLTGLSKTRGGQGLGFETNAEAPSLVPVLSYKVILPPETNVFTMIKNLEVLEEEEPHLNVVWNEKLSEIHVQVMGEIQIEILKNTIASRFGVEVMFGKGNLVYHETIDSKVIGVGHFEPLRHYAEVHLMLEPLQRGEGIQLATVVSEDDLDRQYQRLILTHLGERKHTGVLIDAELTDVKITLVAGRAHNKHTEGGDFREATFRALRNGLMKAKNLLLEPVYAFNLEIPRDMIGKAMSDLERMHGNYEEPVMDENNATIKGFAPVSTMSHYMTEVLGYTKGLGRLSLSFGGYETCHNEEEVITLADYDPENDVDNPAGSVFCSHGAGFGVPWDEVDKYKHIDIRVQARSQDTEIKEPEISGLPRRVSFSGGIDDKELEAIFTKTYGESKRPLPAHRNRLDSVVSNGRKQKANEEVQAEKFLLVDGYNIIFAWDELKALAEENLDTARLRLMDELCNYKGQSNDTILLVFDAYRVAGNRGSAFDYHNIHVVYTKEAETADQYIERLVHEIRPNADVTVATSDIVEQVIILGKGARRLSAEGLLAEVKAMKQEISQHYQDTSTGNKIRPFSDKLKREKS